MKPSTTKEDTQENGYSNWEDRVVESSSYSDWEKTPASSSSSNNNKRRIPEQRSNDVEWSDEFHDLLIALANRDLLTDEEEEQHFENLRRLELDFVYTAETWGRVIIEELFLADEKKTIKPLVGKGTLGGYKYEVRGVFFKFAHEIEYLVNATNAAKVSGHELRACGASALYALESSDCSVGVGCKKELKTPHAH